MTSGVKLATLFTHVSIDKIKANFDIVEACQYFKRLFMLHGLIYLASSMTSLESRRLRTTSGCDRLSGVELTLWSSEAMSAQN